MKMKLVSLKGVKPMIEFVDVHKTYEGGIEAIKVNLFF